ncbi:SspB-related isopeptide-forming adhesin [Streptococcus ruminantium]|uniref:LPXTG cell wall anchor domain-containing protein n=1 Tax=Streptococcus ruminantium TaxID=1917441 RepID=A0ABU1B5U7_9STRE|nr:SspB-related isopeptide-forming adhesin [Streptococcus ruminantium]MDQ8759083.1 LPXTG cell wall anchor domain-containing protein [Streptococcus ruminantium]MDQ8769639.1 LPXTG cell wall anchor domain-containing protein [Streptococcus ruminantium]MDQ8775539.1 LPXTG cell wall anchor domain-containing protein [Streptococcus ruminantium]MDQ8794444.1 LPXTG cell wall anchor domain-containing protein [Streptococcus ruminantium]MDQ8796679.1 LPXTG cell wall anchor domain-containing protein [Streptoco
MYQNYVQGKGYFRKSKAYGLVCGIALFGTLAIVSTVSADEVTTTVGTTPAIEVVNPNPATNLTTVQEAPSKESIAIQEQSGTSKGEVVSSVISSELNNAVDTAKDAGVTVTEETKPVIYNDLSSAQQDLSKQASEVKVAEEKQSQNTTAIKDATATNEEIDRQNTAEAERVAEVNRVGQAEVDARNKAAQEAVDSTNLANKQQADTTNAQLKSEYEAKLAEIAQIEEHNAGVRKRNAEAIAWADAENARLLAEYEAKKAEAQANTSKDGWLKEVINQSLIYTSEPNATATASTNVKFINEAGIAELTKLLSPKAAKFNVSEISLVKETSNVLSDSKYHSSSVPDKPYYTMGNGKAVYLTTFNGNEKVTLTQTGLTNSTFNGRKLTKVEVDISVDKAASLNLGNDTIYLGYTNDFSDGFDIGGYRKDGTDDYKFKVNVSPRFYDENGELIDHSLSGNQALLGFSSLNYHTNHTEGISASGGARVVEINGSSITNHDGIYRADKENTFNVYGEANIDDEKNPNFWRLGAGVVLDGKNPEIGIVVATPNVYGEKQEGSFLNSIWFTLTSTLNAQGIVPQPDYKKVTPELETPVPTTPPTPSYVTPEVVTFTPESYTPIKPVVLPHVSVPEKVTYSATVHPVLVKQAPVNIKSVVNEDGLNVDGQLVPKGSVQTWVLTNTSLKAGRPVTTSYSMTDPLPAGFEVDVKATAEKNSAWVFSYDENGRGVLTATESTLKLLNANLNQDVGIPLAYFVGRTLNDGGTYKNTFVTNIGTPSGIYTTVSNIPVIYTPGNDPKTPRPPREPNGENPTPNDNLIQPKKDVVDEKGNSINGQSVLPNSTLNYVATQDFDQYKGIVASQSAIAKGFMYVDDYLDKALDGQSMVVNSITAKNGDDVRELLDMYHVLSQDTLDEKLQTLIKESGISPVGEFYLWVAKDPEAFYKAYVQKGLDITYNLSFKIKKEFTEGQITNQTFQIDFGNGYYGNIVTNDLPLIAVHKEVLNKDGQSINNDTVSIGDEVVYKLEGWVVPAGRGYDLHEYRFVDLLQKSHDEFKAYSIEASVDITLSDGRVIKAGQDLSAYTETVYNADTGLFELRFREDFLSQIPRSSEFGSDAYLTVTRIASGTVENEYTLYVNGNPVLSNKVVTETPEPPKPEQPEPKQESPALPNTGQSSSLGLTVLGMVALFGSLFGFRKRNEK